MEKHRVLHILYSGMGGTNDYVFNLIKGDKERSFNHFILFFGIEEVPDVNYKIARSLCSEVHVVRKKKGYDKHANHALKQIIDQINPNFISCHINSLIFSLESTKKRKIIFTEHQANELKSRKEWLWSTLAQKRADYIFSLTEDYQKTLRSKLKFLFRENKNYLLHTGIEISDYRLSKNTDDTIRIGMIGRINEFRDHRNLCKAFLQLNLADAELHIAGNGPLLNQLQTEFSDPRIKWHGYLDHHQIVDLLHKLDIYFHASLGETSSIAIMEARASGLPVIATDVRGISNAVTASDGLLVSPENTHEYAEAISLLVSDREKRAALGQASLNYARKHLDNQKMFNNFKELIL